MHAIVLYEPPQSETLLLTNRAVEFTHRSASKWIRLVPKRCTPSLGALTACLWIKYNPILNATKTTLLSYATTTYTKAFVLLFEDEELVIRINSHSHLFGRLTLSNSTFSDNAWHYLCVSWASSDGSWHFYVNGSLASQGTGYDVGEVLESDGAWVVGQDQNSVGSGFDHRQAFKGFVSSVAIWDHVVNITNCGLCCQGNLITCPYFSSSEVELSDAVIVNDDGPNNC
ncbi:neuronal pentraxin receptor-like [Lingula anatina]|uniref:Pentraxin family member n=1 Tax=Lingula anatina TaxID=7574 RepID=A0A1S3IIG1_LINAN|nr:neuronal pentraxin receptor-like [Lingula anatina]|eukprot:XP_013397671.1 neuronal pentraxin receptor-like [Lingula anatina]